MAQLGLTVMRKVGAIDPALASVIYVQEKNALLHSYDEAKRIGDPTAYNHLFGLSQLKGWLINDWPRDAEVTDAIMASTEGFGIADENAQIVATFDTLAAADAALAGARVTMKRSIEIARVPELARASA